VPDVADRDGQGPASAADPAEPGNAALAPEQAGRPCPGEVDAGPAELRLQEMLAELRSARAAACGSSMALAKASHELRTPLNGIIGLAEILRHKAAAGTIGSAEAARLAGDIHESGVYLLNVVEALLDLTRIDAGRQAAPQTIAVRPEIDGALRALGPIAERKRVAIENACAPGLEWPLDRRVFRQVAINLASNAIKFSPREAVVRIAATRCAEALALHVGDQGPGVAEDERERILRPFERGRQAERDGIDGVGLGLTVVAELLKRQGGRLVIESAACGGSVFTAVFPAAQP
jgi:signal transduction histidine kinase